MTWTFQLLLAVFCSEMEDFSSPIVESTYIREERALMHYPFEYSVMIIENGVQGGIRRHSSGKFIETPRGHSMQFMTDLFKSEPMEHLFIEAIISRDKLIRS